MLEDALLCREAGVWWRKTMGTSIEHVVALIPEWRDRRVDVQPIAGGYTNANFRVDVDDEVFFIRIPSPEADLLAIDRKTEAQNTLAAANTGIAPRVLRHLQEHGVLVMEFIHGEPMTISKLQAEGMPRRVAQSIKMLHAGHRFVNEFNIFHLLDHYLRVIAEKDVELPEGFHEHMPLAQQLKDVLAVSPMDSLPCHNDLIPENFIDDGDLLRLVDFEYSGNNDPCFELGNAAMSLEYDEEMTVELCRAYFGDLRRSTLARVQLYGLAAHLTWTAWSCIQKKFSDVAYDFWWNAHYHWDPALKTIQSHAFSKWMEEAQQ